MANVGTTNVPQFSFSDVGFVAPSGPAVLAGVQADWDIAFGVSFNWNLNTPQGQIASSEAALVNNVYALFQYYTQQCDPAYASGRMQDALCRLYFLERNPALSTVLQIACIGAANVVIPLGALIADSSGNLYSCDETGTIPIGGSITLPFSALLPGPIAIPAPTGVSIYGSIPQWDAVTVVSGVIGRNVETRAALEQRRQDTVEGNSFGAIGSIIGAVAKVAGVLDYYGYDNSTNAPVTVNGKTIAANSIYICVEGGTALAVAQAILSKKGPGCAYTGNTTITAYDNNPLYSTPIAYSVSFEIPAGLPILFAVAIVTGGAVPSNANTLIQQAIIAAFSGNNPNVPRARIGSLLLASSYAQAVQALGPWAQIRSLLIGSNNSSGAVFIGNIAANALTVTSTTSGTIAIGQTISDASGLIPAGTTILSGSGSNWVVSNTLTVGASFTGNGSGTNLTASAVTGTIAAGQIVVGTGVPGGTTIVSQTSGTPGGAGVYVTSGATTASSAACTSNESITGAVPASASQQVQINQIPTIDALNIAVTVS